MTTLADKLEIRKQLEVELKQNRVSYEQGNLEYNDYSRIERKLYRKISKNL